MKVILVEQVNDFLEEIESLQRARARYQFQAAYKPKDYDKDVLALLDARIKLLQDRYDLYKQGYGGAIVMTSIGHAKLSP